MGIEPTLFAWEARVLPLNDTRTCVDCRWVLLPALCWVMVWLASAGCDWV